MAKLVVFFIAIVAIQATLAQSNKVDEFKQELKTVQHNVLNSISNITFADIEEKRAVASRANEFAYKLEDAINHLVKLMIHSVEEKQMHVLPDIAMQLNDIVHKVQETIVSHPNQLKVILKDYVQKVFTQMEQIIELFKVLDESSEHEQAHRAVKEIIENLFNAVRKLEIRENLHHQPLYNVHVNNEENALRMSQRIVDILHMINSYDEGTARRLVHEGYDLAQFLRHIIIHFERESYHFTEHSRKLLDDILTQFREIRDSLDQIVQHHEYSNLEQRINELKNQIKHTVEGYSAQVEKLSEVLKYEQKTGNYAEGSEHLIRNVIADSVRKTRNLQAHLEDIAQHHRRY